MRGVQPVSRTKTRMAKVWLASPPCERAVGTMMIAGVPAHTTHDVRWAPHTKKWFCQKCAATLTDQGRKISKKLAARCDGKPPPAQAAQLRSWRKQAEGAAAPKVLK